MVLLNIYYPFKNPSTKEKKGTQKKETFLKAPWEYLNCIEFLHFKEHNLKVMAHGICS